MSIYEFFWHEFCDWYLEIIKITNRMDVALEVFDNTLRLLHPFMPFITEEIWQSLSTVDGELRTVDSIMITPWPQPEKDYIDPVAESQMELLQSLIISIRDICASMRIPAGRKVPVCLKCSKGQEKIIRENELYLKSLASVESIDYQGEMPKESAVRIEKGVEIFVPLKGIVDVKVEREKLKKEKKEVLSRLEQTRNLLLSTDFLSRAPASVVEKTSEREKSFQEKLDKIENDLTILTHQE